MSSQQANEQKAADDVVKGNQLIGSVDKRIEGPPDSKSGNSVNSFGNPAYARNASIKKEASKDQQRKREPERGVEQSEGNESMQGMQAVDDQLGKRKDSRKFESSSSMVKNKNNIKSNPDPNVRLAGVKSSHRSSARGKGAGIRADEPGFEADRSQVQGGYFCCSSKVRTDGAEEDEN